MQLCSFSASKTFPTPHHVPGYLKDASIGVIPFHRFGNADAALPNKLFDYLHAGLPIVTSDCVLMKEFVERWGVGNVFEAENEQSCIEAIRSTVEGMDRHRNSIASNQVLLRECTWERQFEKMLAVYRELEHDGVAASS